MAEKSKKIGDVFKDYKTNSNIKYSYIEALNVNKKTNTLGIQIQSDEYIEVKEIWYLEKFLMERFGFQSIDTIINYTEDVEIKSIKDEWKNLICYMAHKYPLAKPMLLMNADIDLEEDNKINVKMHIKGASFLHAKKSDKVLEELLKKIMGKEYKITITEDLNQDIINKFKADVEKVEKQEVSKVIEKLENTKNNQVANNESSQENVVNEINQTDMVQQDNNDLDNLDNTDQTLILGKESKSKENKIKVKDITPSNAKITLEGRISNLEKRLTRTEKVLVIFDLFDGSGTICCKSFTTKEESDDIISKLEKSDTVKIIGKANLDTYAGDVTVIANTIYLTQNSLIPKKDDVIEEDTPLILGFNQNIGEKVSKIIDLSPEDRKSSFRWGSYKF